jgi:WD40 repeat protein/3',5'-cyclic AMP phosphodiesterase CpdA
MTESDQQVDHPGSSLEFVVRLLTSDGRVAGLGVLVGQREIVTCAHVVNVALGRDQRSQDRANELVTVDFPLAPTPLTRRSSYRAHVECWRPPPRQGAVGDDIAGLVIADDPALPDVTPARLATSPTAADTLVVVFGYPKVPARAEGGLVEAVVRGQVQGERLQLDSTVGAALRIQPGYSGSPIYDREARRVVGILATAPAVESGERDSYATTAAALRRAWPEVLNRRFRARDSRSSTEASAEEPLVTCLHISDLHLGRTLRSGAGKHGAEDGSDDALLGISHDLQDLVTRQKLRPDLIVVTGNLTEHARPSEFDKAMRILRSLADAVDLPADHIALVPGSHDVSHEACAAYFLRQAAEEAVPMPPYWPKWENYATAFNSFYQNSLARTFTPDEPWSFFEIPEVKVVVAGLNSTMPETHLPDQQYGAIGEDQLRWFAERLTDYRQRGWLRLAAVHHDVSQISADHIDNLIDVGALDRILGASGLVNLFLSGRMRNAQVSGLPSSTAVVSSGATSVDESSDHLPPHYQIIGLHDGGLTCYARSYNSDARGWTGEVYPDRVNEERPHAYPYNFPELAMRSPPHQLAPDQVEIPVATPPGGAVPSLSEEFFERVLEATQVSLSDASITSRSAAGYMRVSIPIEGGGCEQWPVGVLTSEPTAEKVAEFIDRVHSQFRAADPQVRSQLVYFGEPAQEAVIAQARNAGVRLRTFVDYSGLIDLQPFHKAQRDRLANDIAYPESGYVAQRFRIIEGGADGPVYDDLLMQLFEWLSVDGPRFIMLLGDSGRGKTYLLHQLTRSFPKQLPGSLPILLELRNLEKAPTLDAIVNQHLYEYHVEGITEPKLRYLISSGRVVILCDGFDELELRVGYENAADYLQTLIGAVGDHAKVVVSSRSQHFQSDEQLRTALGVNIASNSIIRIASIEDFTEEQILKVLTTLYKGDQVKAQARFRLLENIPDLVGLSHNPRMLSFIAGLPDRDLQGIEQKRGHLSGALLYDVLIHRWLAGEKERHSHPGGLAPLKVDERRKACTALALRLWESAEPTFPAADLSHAVVTTLTDLLDRGYTTEEAAQAVGSGTLLVRTEDGAFSFVHRSIMEWLVAKAAEEEISGGGTSLILQSRRFSALMINFLCDLTGHESARHWAATVLRETGPSEAAKQNALAVDGRLKVGVRKRLPGVDLRGQDLAGEDLSDADLRRATLRGMRIVNTDFRRADLRDADLSGARLTACDLSNAKVEGSIWDGSALVGVSGLRSLQAAQELLPAAVIGRDAADPMIGLGGPALAVAVSHDGALAAVGKRCGVELYDLATGELVRVLSGHRGQIWGLAFSPKGGILVTGSTDGSAKIWEIATGEVRHSLSDHAGPVWDVAISPDQTLAATASHDHTVRLWDTATGTMRATLTGHEGPVWGVAFSPDGSLIATASHDRTARIWNSERARTVAVLSGHSDWVRAITFSPDGSLIATGSNDQTVRIWDAEGGTVRTALVGHQGPVRSVSFSPPDGALIASASHDHTIRLWDTSTGQVRQALANHTRPVNGVAFSPDGALIASASDDGSVRIQDVVSDTTRMSFTGQAGWIWDAALAPSAATVAVESHNGFLGLWNLATRHRIDDSLRFDSPIVGAVFSPDGSSLAVSCRDDNIRIWRRGHTIKVLNDHTRAVRASAFSADGQLLVTGSEDTLARIWDIATGELREELRGHTEPVNGVTFSLDGKLVATGSDDTTVRVWDTATGQLRVTLSGHTRPVNSVAFSPDGSLVASGSDDATARIWSLTVALPRLVISDAHTDWIHAVAFSSDGSMLATGSADAIVRVWNADTGQLMLNLTGHAAAVRKLRFSAANDVLATAADDGAVRIWDISEGELIRVIAPLMNGGYAALSPDGKYSICDEGPDSSLWWAVKLCRFLPGELDKYDTRIRRADS